MLAKSQASKDGEIIAFGFVVIGIRVLRFVLFCFVVLLECESTFCMCGILKMVRGVLEAGKGKNGAARLMSS
tara:strand:- start:380 stop:595 length:216 start_codon:yes stop_codon:yes gene_type:complete